MILLYIFLGASFAMLILFIAMIREFKKHDVKSDVSFKDEKIQS